jgi:hypothetical protein
MADAAIDLDKYQKVAEAMIAAKRYKDTHRREFVDADSWYSWQHQSFESDKQQTMLMAANRSGKTMSAGYHFALDLTGDYPEWWQGGRFRFGTDCVALGVDNLQLKDVVQKELFGDVIDKQFTGGWVHPSEIVNVEWSPQTVGLARRVTIRSKFGTSFVTLRSYTQSKTGQATLSFAGTSKDVIWVDECPPDALVGQLVMRTMTGNQGSGGKIRYTMTPELGVTKLVNSFMEQRNDEIQLLIGPVTWDDCPHLTPEQKEAYLAGVPEHERDMRSKGVPFFGSGLVYPIPEDRVVIDPFPLSQRPWLRVIRAMDLGIGHPTAIVWLAYDAEFDCVYLVRDYSVTGGAAAVHAAAANGYLPQAPCVFPPDVDQTEKGSGKTVRKWYAEAGLKNTLDFRNPDGSTYVEPGILELYERMTTDRFKIFRGCNHALRELRMYHRKDGKLVKQDDDVLDAVRYGTQMIRSHGALQSRKPGHKPRVKRAIQ